MNNIFKYLMVLAALLIFTSCEKNTILIPEDTSYVTFEKGNVTISEDAGEATLTLYYTTFSTERAEVAIAVSTEGLSAPAVEGEDFDVLNKTVVFENGLGYATVNLKMIDNDIFEGSKQFYLEITSVPAGTKTGIDGRGRVLVTIADDEHPLKIFKGRYSHAHTNYFGAEYNYTSTTIIDVNPLDIHQILISNICSTSLNEVRPVAATIDEENQQIIIKSKQGFTAVNGGGYYFAFNAGIPKDDGTNPEPIDEEVIGSYTIDTGSGAIVITLKNWGPKWIEPNGDFDGWWWYDFFTTSTMTKLSK